jgi:hypothetical protein
MSVIKRIFLFVNVFILLAFSTVLSGERQPIHGEKLPDRGAENFDLMPDIDISKLSEEDKQFLRMLGWSSEYLKNVAKEFSKDIKDVLRIEREAPSICKEKRENCLAGCITDDCKQHCFTAFYECAERYGVR